MISTRARIVVERRHQRIAAVDVEVVGRLVEDQHARPAEGDEPKQQPRLLAARQVLFLTGVSAMRERRSHLALTAAAAPLSPRCS